MAEVTRFAPSPTGALHLGHVHAALFARRQAAGGRWLVRMEDTDRARCRPDFALAILDDLRWLGLVPDGTVRVQSEHMDEYRAALERLRAEGLLYACFCSRADVARAVTAPHGLEAVYPGTCRGLSATEAADRIAAGQPHAWRLDSGAAMRRAGPLSFHEQGRGRLACDPASFGDVVLGRRDAPASYHLAVSHDDALQGVTLVTRGEDLRDATAVHRLLQAVMGWPEPGYAHHRLLTGPDGRRLSKRDGAAGVRALREAGHSVAEILSLACEGH